MRKLSKKEIAEFRKDTNTKSVDTSDFLQTLKSIPKDEARKILKTIMDDHEKAFPKLAEKMIKFGLLTREEFEKEWNHPDMYEVFLYTLTGDIQKHVKSGEEINMVTTSEFKLARKRKIFKKFGVKVLDPMETSEKMKKEDPKTWKEAMELAHDDIHSSDYIG